MLDWERHQRFGEMMENQEMAKRVNMRFGVVEIFHSEPKFR
jgi:hypothetical protein